MNPTGKWACTVDSMLFRGEAMVNIFEKDGSYDFELELSGVDIPEYTVKSVDIGENHLKAVINIAMLGKDAELDIDFDDDSFTGILKIPFIGKIKLKNGHRV